MRVTVSLSVQVSVKGPLVNRTTSISITVIGLTFQPPAPFQGAGRSAGPAWIAAGLGQLLAQPLADFKRFD